MTIFDSRNASLCSEKHIFLREGPWLGTVTTRWTDGETDERHNDFRRAHFACLMKYEKVLLSRQEEQRNVLPIFTFQDV
jgi:hypothetical protein